MTTEKGQMTSIRNVHMHEGIVRLTGVVRETSWRSR